MSDQNDQGPKIAYIYIYSSCNTASDLARKLSTRLGSLWFPNVEPHWFKLYQSLYIGFSEGHYRSFLTNDSNTPAKMANIFSPKNLGHGLWVCGCLWSCYRLIPMFPHLHKWWKQCIIWSRQELNLTWFTGHPMVQLLWDYHTILYWIRSVRCLKPLSLHWNDSFIYKAMTIYHNKRSWIHTHNYRAQEYEKWPQKLELYSHNMPHLHLISLFLIHWCLLSKTMKAIHPPLRLSVPTLLISFHRVQPSLSWFAKDLMAAQWKL